jgi:subtilase family serine protease
MASAMCPNCTLYLMEAKTNSANALAKTVAEAALLGAHVISNSYGGHEGRNTKLYAPYYDQPGVAVTASTGDSGFGVQSPADMRTVIAVGGTHLTHAANARGWAETVWSGAGSGCSAYIAKPSWQTDGGCARRTVADVAAVADPNTGVSVYDTYRLHPGGWLVFGGTSVAAPVIGGVYALAGNAGSLTYGSASYANLGSVFDVTSGSNGSCGGSYLCTGKVGFDGPTGNGTPNGIGGY